MRQRPRLLSGVVVALCTLVLPIPALAGAPSESAQVRAQLAGVRLPFIANQGQVDAQVAYYAPTFAGTLFVTQRGELVYALSGPRTDAPRDRFRPSSTPGWSLTETLPGGRARPVAQDRSTAGVSTFLGNDPARWRGALPTWEQVSLGEVWPGVTVALRARGRSMEKVFTVQPGGAVGHIRVRVAGAHALTVDGEGALVADTGLGAVKFTAPVAYQERDGVRRPVVVAYRHQGFEYGFSVGAYDRGLPLVIDPLLQSTYLGGSGKDEARALAIHPTTGDVYVAGVTQATYLGGSGTDQGLALAIHPTTGDVYVTGDTTSSNFPGTAGGVQPAIDGGTDAFVARLSSTLTSLTRATYLGGSGTDDAFALAIHSTTGDVYGRLHHFEPLSWHHRGGAQPALRGAEDAFVARLTFSLALVDPALSIPTLSEWALLAMIALLLMTGLLALRCRRWAH